MSGKNSTVMSSYRSEIMNSGDSQILLRTIASFDYLKHFSSSKSANCLFDPAEHLLKGEQNIEVARE